MLPDCLIVINVDYTFQYDLAVQNVTFQYDLAV